jgi:hypothetical protein
VLAVLNSTLKEPTTTTTAPVAMYSGSAVFSGSAPNTARAEATTYSPKAATKGWLSSAPLFANNSHKAPLQQVPEAYSAISETTDAFLSGKDQSQPKAEPFFSDPQTQEEMSPKAQTPKAQTPKAQSEVEASSVLPFATYYNANMIPSSRTYLLQLYDMFAEKRELVYPDLPDVKEMDAAIKKIQGVQRRRAERTRAQMTRKRNTVRVKTDDMNGAPVWEITLTKRENNSKYGFWHDNAKVEFAKEYAKALQIDTSDATSADLNNLLAPDERPEALLVKRIIKKQLLAEWNLVHPEAEVRPGDKIIAVNGATTIMEMQKELRAASITCKLLRSPEVFSTELHKGGQTQRKLGFKFEKPANSEVLRITEVVKDGLLDETNRSHMKKGCHHLVVMPGMRIEAANGIAQNTDKLLDMIKKNDAVQLQIRRHIGVKGTESAKPAPPPLGS